jgi:hypothetical protein
MERPRRRGSIADDEDSEGPVPFAGRAHHRRVEVGGVLVAPADEEENGREGEDRAQREEDPAPRPRLGGQHDEQDDAEHDGDNRYRHELCARLHGQRL